MNFAFIRGSAAYAKVRAGISQGTIEMRSPSIIVAGLVLGGSLATANTALAQDDMHARVRVTTPHRPAPVHVDRLNRVPPGVRVRAVPGRVTVRVNPFRAHLGGRISLFGPRERAVWTHGRWRHGRHNGRFGWWWWADGGWYFYDAPIYPYPDYVSQYVYQEPTEDNGDYWYYCRDPQGYYPYVKRCYGSWEPVPAEPEGGYDQGGAGYEEGGPGYDQGGPGYGEGGGPDDDQMGPDAYGPPDEGPADREGPPDDDQGPPPPR
jgi:hypothetical protein